VCLLGASNLTRGFRPAVRVARGALGGPLEVFAALGRGRSYGADSHFLGRMLPGIDTCGLWSALERASAARPLPAHALVCDVGNDVAYGVSASQLLGWVERAVDRCAAAGARCTLVGTPVERLRTLAPGTFRFWSRLFFPGHGVRHDSVLATLDEVERGLRDLAEARGLAFVEPRSAWYGLDPIHVRHRCLDDAWRVVLASWSASDAAAGASGATWRGRVPLPPPLERRVLGRTYRRAQPAGRLADGSSISVY